MKWAGLTLGHVLARLLLHHGEDVGSAMADDDRIAALEARLRAAEDHLEILNLLNSYGPLVDSGSAEEAPRLWVEGGGYDFSLPGGGTGRLEAPAGLAAMYAGEGHMGLVGAGVSHLTATPRIKVDGDSAEAVGYSFVILKEGERWIVWRGAINHWKLVRTAEGWRVGERFNRTLDGSAESRETMRKVLEP